MVRYVIAPFAAAACILTAPVMAPDGLTKAGRDYVSGTITLKTPPPPELLIRLSCAVRGTTVDFPNEIVLYHPGPLTVPSGTQVAWTAGNGQYKGSVSLPTLLLGERFQIQNAMPGGLPPGAPCKAKHIKN